MKSREGGSIFGVRTVAAVRHRRVSDRRALFFSLIYLAMESRIMRHGSGRWQLGMQGWTSNPEHLLWAISPESELPFRSHRFFSLPTSCRDIAPARSNINRVGDASM